MMDNDNIRGGRTFVSENEMKLMHVVFLSVVGGMVLNDHWTDKGAEEQGEKDGATTTRTVTMTSEVKNVWVMSSKQCREYYQYLLKSRVSYTNVHSEPGGDILIAQGASPVSLPPSLACY